MLLMIDNYEVHFSAFCRRFKSLKINDLHF